MLGFLHYFYLIPTYYLTLHTLHVASQNSKQVNTWLLVIFLQILAVKFTSLLSWRPLFGLLSSHTCQGVAHLLNTHISMCALQTHNRHRHRHIQYHPLPPNSHIHTLSFPTLPPPPLFLSSFCSLLPEGGGDWTMFSISKTGHLKLWPIYSIRFEAGRVKSKLFFMPKNTAGVTLRGLGKTRYVSVCVRQCRISHVMAESLQLQRVVI